MQNLIQGRVCLPARSAVMKWRPLAVIIAILAMLLGTWPGSTPLRAAEPDVPDVMFLSGSNMAPDLYSYKIGGSPKKVPLKGVVDCVLTRDGSTIYLVEMQPGHELPPRTFYYGNWQMLEVPRVQISRANSDGSDKRVLFKVPNGTFASQLALSADDTMLAFEWAAQRRVGVRIMSVTGGTPQAVVLPTVPGFDLGYDSCYCPSFTDNGKSLLVSVSCLSDDPLDGVVINLRTGRGKAVRRGVNSSSRRAVSSPDGSLILFADLPGSLYSSKADGSAVHMVRKVAQESWIQLYTWARDGRSVFYTVARSGAQTKPTDSLWNVQCDGSNPTKVAELGTYEGGFNSSRGSWLPDW